MTLRRVILESPFSGDVAVNIAYAKLCLRDCLNRKEAPIASHLLIAAHGILDDLVPEERSIGMSAGWEWIPVAEALVVYEDRGISQGMKAGIACAEVQRIPIEYRTLPNYKDLMAPFMTENVAKVTSSPKPSNTFAVDQLWRTRSGQVAKIIAISNANQNYRWMLLHMMGGVDNKYIDVGLKFTCGPDGRHFPSLEGENGLTTLRDHADDLIELVTIPA